MQSKLLKSKVEASPSLSKIYGGVVIGVDMASGPDESVAINLNTASFFADKTQVFPDTSERLSVCHMVNAITTLAMLNAEVLHIEVFYEPHCADLNIKVHKADANYFGIYKAIFRRSVHLDQLTSLMQLKTLEDDLIELVAEAKDRLMGAV
jgi:hypothetical protein